MRVAQQWFAGSCILFNNGLVHKTKSKTNVRVHRMSLPATYHCIGKNAFGHQGLCFSAFTFKLCICFTFVNWLIILLRAYNVF